MNSLERRSSFDTAGLKKTKAKSVKEETVDVLFTDTVDDAVTSVRNWIEVCANYCDVNEGSSQHTSFKNCGGVESRIIFVNNLLVYFQFRHFEGKLKSILLHTFCMVHFT